MNIQKMRSNQRKKAKDTATLRHLDTVEKNNTWVLDEQLRSILGGNIAKGVKIAILGKSGQFKTGFMHYLVAQMMHNRKRVELARASVVLQTNEDACEKSHVLFRRALWMNQGRIKGKEDHSWKSWPRYMRKNSKTVLRHSRKHHYYPSFCHFGPGAEVVENITIFEGETTTVIETHYPQRDMGENDSYYTMPIFAQASVVFMVHRMRNAAGEYRIYLQVLKHRGKIIDRNKAIELDKVNDYFRYSV